MFAEQAGLPVYALHTDRRQRPPSGNDPLACGGFLLQRGEYLLHQLIIFDASDDLYGATALTAGLDVNHVFWLD